ncbi:hypothetical protein N7474_003834 [Penicillium riverlandense]|uniref:uncharacterized protein n=1 Tax=Penicillium riverlandense TaxID=1903569 RepID=UPI0025486421|nr:uncharacterized protein N7474_003834 [Penicillium riverlandense]KAJ5818243.1 hypothetical protein N7474_003834 [Penicillium riverlandense]
MYTILPLAALGLAATSGAFANPALPTTIALPTSYPNANKSFEALVETLPRCHRRHIKQGFTQEFAPSCGVDSYSSSDSSDNRCVCEAMHVYDFMRLISKGGSFLQTQCPGLTDNESLEAIGKIGGLWEMCAPYGQKYAAIAAEWLHGLKIFGTTH